MNLIHWLKHTLGMRESELDTARIALDEAASRYRKAVAWEDESRQHLATAIRNNTVTPCMHTGHTDAVAATTTAYQRLNDAQRVWDIKRIIAKCDGTR